MQQNQGNEKFFNKKSIKAVITGALSGIVAIILLFFIVGFAVTKMNSYPEGIINYVLLTILGIGGFLSGYITGRIYKSSGLLYGAVTGVVIFIFIFIAGLGSIANGVTLFTLYKLAVLVITSALGGILGVNKKEKIHIK